MADILTEIEALKLKKNATVLAHFYEDGDIQDAADEVGDSFFLAKKGQESSADLILLAGVVFMAESVKILNPEKKVLVPDLGAGCSLVEGAPYGDYLQWRLQHPDGIAVTYINSSAEVKAISDVIVTSSNAAQIVGAIPKDRPILFGPDQNLGRWLSRELKRDMVLWPGSCEVHVLFSARKLFELTQEHPEALVIAHPECEEAVLQYAQVIGSTSKLLKTVEEHPSKSFIVATETGIFHQMQKARPEAQLIQAPVEGSCACNNCPYMKMNTLAKIKKALEDEKPEVTLDPLIMELASTSLRRMMDITAGKQVTWPETFRVPDFSRKKVAHVSL